MIVNSRIFVRGSWDNWQKDICLEEGVNLAIGNTKTHFQFIRVKQGRYNYKFIVDGQWQHDQYKLSENDG